MKHFRIAIDCITPIVFIVFIVWVFSYPQKMQWEVTPRGDCCHRYDSSCFFLTTDFRAQVAWENWAFAESGINTGHLFKAIDCMILSKLAQ